MAAIQINNLQPAGTDLFNDSESFLQELSQEDIATILGGGDHDVEVEILWTGICFKF